jgi:hypothetical protein
MSAISTKRVASEAAKISRTSRRPRRYSARQVFHAIQIVADRRVEELLPRIEDLPIAIRQLVIIALGNLNCKSAIPHLYRLIQREDEAMSCAATSLAKMSSLAVIDQSISLLQASHKKWVQHTMIEVLMQSTITDVPLLRRVLETFVAIAGDKERKSEVRAVALEAFAIRAGRQSRRTQLFRDAKSVVLRSLNDSSAEVVASACYASGQMQIEQARTYLTRLLKSRRVAWKTMYVRDEAWNALQRMDTG